MNDKQRTFCEEYLIDLNATQAAIRAGYSKKTAHSQGPRLLENVEVAKYIAKHKEKRSQKAEVDAQWVLDQTVEAIQAARDDDAHSAVSSLLKLAGQHIDVRALVSTKETTTKHIFEELSDEELQKRLDAIDKE